MFAQFLQAIAWNTISLFFYKSILLIHQIALFSAISQQTYGIIGTIFAAMYLLIGLTNFGFEYSLFPFFSEYSTTKKAFSVIIKQYCYRLFTILISATFLPLFLRKRLSILFHALRVLADWIYL